MYILHAISGCMDFEWDENKNRINIAKHGIAFETALGFSKDRPSIGLMIETTMMKNERSVLA